MAFHNAETRIRYKSGCDEVLSRNLSPPPGLFVPSVKVIITDNPRPGVTFLPTVFTRAKSPAAAKRTADFRIGSISPRRENRRAKADFISSPAQFAERKSNEGIIRTLPRVSLPDDPRATCATLGARARGSLFLCLCVVNWTPRPSAAALVPRTARIWKYRRDTYWILNGAFSL